jgi:MFS family permease
MMSTLAQWWPAVLLGVATIGAYGIANYAIGVLLPVIGEDTGWSSGLLSGSFSLGALGQGAIALLAGRTLDRYGSRPVLLPALLSGAGLLFLASLAQEPWQFAISWALGAALIGGGLYYSLTMPATARLYPARRATAFSILTLLGALAGPIFYPLAGYMSEAWGWRAALQALVGLTLLCAGPAALLVRAPASSTRVQAHEGAALRAALRRPAIYRVLLVFALIGMANSALLLHQVAAMEAAGLSIALAAWFAGARGAFQIPGRLLLTPLTGHFGVRGSLALCYFCAATATAALLVAVLGVAPTILAAYFTVVCGMSLGLLAPLNGLLQADVYGDAQLGTLSGVSVIMASVAGASGAFITGLALDATDSYRLPLTMIMTAQLLAIAALAWQRSATPGRPSFATQPLQAPADLALRE